MNKPYWIENPEDHGDDNRKFSKKWAPNGEPKEPTVTRVSVLPKSDNGLPSKDEGQGGK